MEQAFRIERDALGERRVPAEAYWGIHTERARENFPFSGHPVPPSLIQALAAVKLAAARANRTLGFLPDAKADAIERACDELIAGRLAEQFPLSALQGGAGTSTHMNVNEVIANRASESLGGARGADALIAPLADVNRHQSTNDVYPTAVKIAAIRGCRKLSSAIEQVQGALQRKESTFAGIVKIGRTQTQEAVPITLGAEFGVFAEAFARDRWRTFKCEERLRTINMGGTAVGTGLTAPRAFIFLVTEKLREVTGLPLARAENMMDPTANADVFVEVSGILKAHAASLVKICGDIRWLHALGEIQLEKLQAGSSIMPGKVNPVVMEAGIQVGLKVMANDVLVAEAVSRGTFQICEFLPVVAVALLASLTLLAEFNLTLAGHIDAIQPDAAACRRRADVSPALITAFLPDIGYEAAEALLAEYGEIHQNGQDAVPLRNFLERKLGATVVQERLSPENLMSFGDRP